MNTVYNSSSQKIQKSKWNQEREQNRENVAEEVMEKESESERETEECGVKEGKWKREREEMREVREIQLNIDRGGEIEM